jgi:hypothetical protein
VAASQAIYLSISKGGRRTNLCFGRLDPPARPMQAAGMRVTAGAHRSNLGSIKAVAQVGGLMKKFFARRTRGGDQPPLRCRGAGTLLRKEFEEACWGREQRLLSGPFRMPAMFQGTRPPARHEGLPRAECRRRFHISRIEQEQVVRRILLSDVRNDGAARLGRN